MTGKTLRLYVERPVLRSEVMGEPVGEFERTGRVARFKVKPISGREYVQGQQVQSNITHELKCPHFTDEVHTGMRLTAGDNAEAPTRIFNVESVVNENEANRFLVWRVAEVPA